MKQLFGLGLAMAVAAALIVEGAPRVYAAEKKAAKGPTKSNRDRSVILDTVPSAKGSKSGPSDGKYIIRKLPGREK